MLTANTFTGKEMIPYVYQAAQLDQGGAVQDVCHERPFEAADLDAAIVTAGALHEVLKVAEHCNSIRVLDAHRAVLWSRLVDGVDACP
jgi:hypothetical protein